MSSNYDANLAKRPPHSNTQGNIPTRPSYSDTQGNNSLRPNHTRTLENPFNDKSITSSVRSKINDAGMSINQIKSIAKEAIDTLGIKKDETLAGGINLVEKKDLPKEIDFALGFYRDNSLTLNVDSVGSTPDQKLDFVNTIYHELEHAWQDENQDRIGFNNMQVNHSNHDNNIGVGSDYSSRLNAPEEGARTAGISLGRRNSRNQLNIYSSQSHMSGNEFYNDFSERRDIFESMPLEKQEEYIEKQHIPTKKVFNTPETDKVAKEALEYVPEFIKKNEIFGKNISEQDINNIHSFLKEDYSKSQGDTTKLQRFFEVGNRSNYDEETDFLNDVDYMDRTFRDHVEDKNTFKNIKNDIFNKMADRNPAVSQLGDNIKAALGEHGLNLSEETANQISMESLKKYNNLSRKIDYNRIERETQKSVNMIHSTLDQLNISRDSTLEEKQNAIKEVGNKLFGHKSMFLGAKGRNLSSNIVNDVSDSLDVNKVFSEDKVNDIFQKNSIYNFSQEEKDLLVNKAKESFVNSNGKMTSLNNLKKLTSGLDYSKAAGDNPNVLDYSQTMKHIDKSQSYFLRSASNDKEKEIYSNMFDKMRQSVYDDARKYVNGYSDFSSAMQKGYSNTFGKPLSEEALKKLDDEAFKARGFSEKNLNISGEEHAPNVVKSIGYGSELHHKFDVVNNLKSLEKFDKTQNTNFAGIISKDLNIDLNKESLHDIKTQAQNELRQIENIEQKTDKDKWRASRYKRNIANMDEQIKKNEPSIGSGNYQKRETGIDINKNNKNVEKQRITLEKTPKVSVEKTNIGFDSAPSSSKQNINTDNALYRSNRINANSFRNEDMKLAKNVSSASHGEAIRKIGNNAVKKLAKVFR